MTMPMKTSAAHTTVYKEDIMSPKENRYQRIAVTYNDGQIFQQFGRTKKFMIYDVQNGKVTIKTLINIGDSGHGALADILKKLQVDILICGALGTGALRALKEAQIMVHSGITGTTDQAVKRLLEGKMQQTSEPCCVNQGKHHSIELNNKDHNQGTG